MPQAKFKSFQDDNDTAPFEEIKQAVERELRAPLSSIFESFDEKCLASASIAQARSYTRLACQYM